MPGLLKERLSTVNSSPKAMSLEEFRTEMENDEETFEVLLEEFERLPDEQRHTH